MMISTTLVSLSAVGVLPGRSGSTLVLPHPASNDAPATPAPDIFKNSLRVNVRLSLFSCIPLACTDNHRASSVGSLIVPGIAAGQASGERCDPGQAGVQSVHDGLSLRAAALRGRGVRTPRGSDAGQRPRP